MLEIKKTKTKPKTKPSVRLNLIENRIDDWTLILKLTLSINTNIILLYQN